MTGTRILIKKILLLFGIDPRKLYEKVGMWSIHRAIAQKGLYGLVERLREIVPDVSDQESSEKEQFNAYWELKRRSLQAFQCSLMLNLLDTIHHGELTIVDVGDSAGTHMLYLKELTKGKFSIDTISVNLDPRAIKKIEARGLKAILCRAEELDLGEKNIDLITSFQMVEHLHNPAIFFRRLAKKARANRMLITVPYIKNSRVGLHQIRFGTRRDIFAEEEHIFELNPQDWTLLLLHSGWRVVHSEIYFQYPRGWPLVSALLKRFWRAGDFEGFWGAVIEKDLTFSDYYRDWEE